MIDARLEDLITLDDAAKIAPGYRAGHCYSTAAVRRWARSGMRGVRLETIVAGGRRCTSRAAVQRFFQALTRARDGEELKPRRRHQRPLDSVEVQVALKERHGMFAEAGR